MKSLKEQTDAKIEAGRKANPDFMKGVDEIIAQAKAFQQGSDAIQVGQQAPGFELPDPEGKAVSLAALLARGLLFSHFIVAAGARTATCNCAPCRHAWRRFRHWALPWLPSAPRYLTGP